MSPLTRRRGVLLLVLAAAIAASLALRVRHAAETPPADTLPPGFWRVDALEARERSDEALARQLSLPYAAGSLRATDGRTGVRAWSPTTAQPGWNLYVSGHALEAVLLAMDGRPLHRWRTTLAKALPGLPRTSDNGFFRRAALLADGSLLALVQGGGLIRLDPSSEVVWRFSEPVFNDLWVAGDESSILVLAKRAASRPEIRAEGPVLEDQIVTLNANGRVLGRASLLDALERSPFRDVLVPPGRHADVLHANTVTVLEGPGRAGRDLTAAGNLLISMREIHTVAILDPTGREVLWAQRGPFRFQHEPSLDRDGKLLLFDNQGGEHGLSRVATVDLASGAVTTQFAGFPGETFSSREAGSCYRLGNGNLLVVSSEQGVAWELTPAGEIAWELRSPHRAGPRRELVAALFDVVRYETATPFLARFPLAAPSSAQSP